MPPRKDGRTRWLCDCDCGSSCIAFSYALRKKTKVSCGCGKIKDLTGARFGRLIVLRRSSQYIDTTRGKKYLWECICDCGATVHRLSEKLRDDVNCSCRSCMERFAVTAMVNSAGFIEGTQLSKLVCTSPNTNSTSGVRGVFFNRRTGKWRASIKFQGKSRYLGEYEMIEDAIKARQRAEEQIFAPMLEKYGAK